MTAAPHRRAWSTAPVDPRPTRRPSWWEIADALDAVARERKAEAAFHATADDAPRFLDLRDGGNLAPVGLSSWSWPWLLGGVALGLAGWCAIAWAAWRLLAPLGWWPL